MPPDAVLGLRDLGLRRVKKAAAIYRANCPYWVVLSVRWLSARQCSATLVAGFACCPATLVVRPLDSALRLTTAGRWSGCREDVLNRLRSFGDCLFAMPWSAAGTSTGQPSRRRGH